MLLMWCSVGFGWTMISSPYYYIAARIQIVMISITGFLAITLLVLIPFIEIN